MFGLNVADHEIWTVEGVGQGVLVGRLVQKFNHTWEREREREIHSVNTIADLWLGTCKDNKYFV